MCTLFSNILKKKQWIFTSLCRHNDISKVYLHNKKVRTRGLILLELLSFVKFLNAAKISFYAQYLFNQWLEFDQTNVDMSLRQGK